MSQTSKKLLYSGIFVIVIPVIIILGATVFQDKQYAWISLCVVLLSCLPFFLSFELKQPKTEKLVLISVLTALSVVGRIAFAAVPAFKPVTAMVVIAAIYFGSEAGFMTGALTAVISNFYFGQGPWTPFQMFVWGIIGFMAGKLATKLENNRLLLAVYGAFAGIAFSLLMDVWTVLWWDGTFNPERYFASIITALPFTAMYAVSNIIFLLILEKPFGKKLKRIKTKYGI